MKKSFYSLALCCSVLGAGACTIQDIYGPSGRPRGYAHYNDEFKTIVPERPYFIGKSYTEEEAIESEILWTTGVNELLNELEQNAVMGGLSISLQPIQPTNGFDVRMDHYLRKALKDRGYLIVTEPLDTIPTLKYTARLPGYKDGVQQKGRAIDNIDDIQNQYDVLDDPKNQGRPFVFMGIEVHDLSAPPKDQLLLSVETLQNVLDKDVREIRGALIDPPIIAGPNPRSNLNN